MRVGKRIFDALAVLLLVVPLVVGAMVLQSRGRGVLAQESVDAPNLPARQIREYHAAARSPEARQGGLAILTYHDVRPGADDPFTVSPEQFAAQMAMLDAAGFHTVGAGDLVRFVHGAPIPPRSVLITFDDGTSGLWKYADGVLAKHHFRAMSFVITGRVGSHRPYYMNWKEIEGLAQSGRWDIESHTRNSHVRVPIDDHGHRGPALTNRLWLAGRHRLETLDEYRKRVTEDLVGSKRDLALHGLDRVPFLAYPFSASATPTNDPRVVPILRNVVNRQFTASLTDTEPDRIVGPGDFAQRILPRVEVFASTSAHDLFRRLATTTPMALQGPPPLDRQKLWSLRPSAGADHARFTANGLALAPEPSKTLTAYYGEGRTAGWHDYRVEATVGGLGGPGSGTTGSLVALAGSNGEVRVSTSANWLRIRLGIGPTATTGVDRRIAAAPRHQVTIEAHDDRVVVVVDGATVLDRRVDLGAGAVASGGIGVDAQRNTSDAPVPVFTGLTVAHLSSQPPANGANGAG